MSDEHNVRITRNEEDIEKLDQEGKTGRNKLWQAIDKIKNRPPLWCTFLLVGLSSTLTGLIVRTLS